MRWRSSPAREATKAGIRQQIDALYEPDRTAFVDGFAAVVTPTTVAIDKFGEFEISLIEAFPDLQIITQDLFAEGRPLPSGGPSPNPTSSGASRSG